MIAISIASAPAALQPVTASAAAPELEWAAVLATITGAMRTAPGSPRAPPDGEDEPPGGMPLPLPPPLVLLQATALSQSVPDAGNGIGPSVPMPLFGQGQASPESSGQLPAVPPAPLPPLPEEPSPVIARNPAGTAVPPPAGALQAVPPAVSTTPQPVTATPVAAWLAATVAGVVEAGPPALTGQYRGMDRRVAGPSPAPGSMPSTPTGPVPVLPAPRPMSDGPLEERLPDPLPAVEAPRPGPVLMPLGSSAATIPTPAGAVDPQGEPVSMPLSAPLGSEEWQEQLAGRTSWLVDQGQGRAQLRLNPPQLGVVDVQVQVDGERASVAFTAHSPAAREALELALPRLRDMLGGQGFSGVDVSVSHHSLPGRSSERQPLPAGEEATVSTLSFARPGSSGAVPARGRFDAYA